MARAFAAPEPRGPARRPPADGWPASPAWAVSARGRAARARRQRRGLEWEGDSSAVDPRYREGIFVSGATRPLSMSALSAAGGCGAIWVAWPRGMGHRALQADLAEGSQVIGRQ